MSVVADPRLAQAATPSVESMVRRLAAIERDIGARIIEADRDLWPKGVNGTYRVVHYNGKTSVEFDMPAVKEPGFGGSGPR